MDEKKSDDVNGTLGTSASFDPMLPLLAGMYCGLAKGSEKPSRKHDFQQVLFTLLKPCATEAEAKELLLDMQEALDSTKSVVGSMVW